MTSQDNRSWVKAAGRRMAVVAALIVIVTLFWVALLFYADLSAWVMAGIAVVGLVLLSVAVSWAAMAAPARRSARATPGTDAPGKDA